MFGSLFSCNSKKYLSELPPASVIIIFYNEWPSVLYRTIHSVYNRTPREILKEIILVDDNSTKVELNGLEQYVSENFDSRVKVVRLKERKGLIVTRMEGARRATGETLVFLDSHIEVNRSVASSLASFKANRNCFFFLFEVTGCRLCWNLLQCLQPWSPLPLSTFSLPKRLLTSTFKFRVFN